MKTLEAIEQALSIEYNKSTYNLAPIKDIDGYDYISWSESANLANKLFGPLGWSSSVLACSLESVEVEVEVNGETKLKRHTGYKAIVRVSVHVMLEDGEIHTSHHDGVGFGPLMPMGRKKPMDNASKSAKSDGISTAIKHFGDHFGLFLYDKPAAPTYSANTNPPKSNAGGDRKPVLSEGRERVLRNKGFSNGDIQQIQTRWTIQQVVALCDDLMKNQMGTTEAQRKYNLGAVAAGIELEDEPF